MALNRNGTATYGLYKMREQEYDQYARDYIEFAKQMFNKYNQTPEMKEEFYEMVNDKMDVLKSK